jgi:hypothetical protein
MLAEVDTGECEVNSEKHDKSTNDVTTFPGVVIN